MEQLNQTSTPIWGDSKLTDQSDRVHLWQAVQDAYLTTRFEWNLIAFACGIALYFALPFEPGFSVIAVLSGLAVTLLIFNAKYWHFGAVLLPIMFCMLGVVYSVFHSHQAASPMLPKYHKKYAVEGWIEEAGSSGSMQRIYVRVDRIDGLAPHKTPKRIRIRLKPGEFVPGDTIRINAILNRPPGPAIAGGFDPARRAYFEQIGGYGFAVGVPEVLDTPSESISLRLKRGLVTFRYALSTHIQTRAPPSTAGLQAALLTGDRSAIPENHERYLRDAGLAHLLAISGLHMGLLAGGAYYLASLLFSMIGPWARRYDMRKAAALVGIAFATGYLLLSGASVSTQRAYIMAVIVFVAVIMDRRAVSMRSVAVAAVMTLLLHPENLLNAGFHMSFSATAALVAVYRAWADRRDIYKEQFRSNSLISRFWRGFLGLSVTSFVAGTATAGFAALHFHRIAKYGFVGNLAAMPVFTFLAMPAGFLAVLLIPFGLDIYMLKVMSLGLDYILAVSKWVTELDGAITYLKGADSLVISVFGLGFALLCIGPNTVRIFATSLIVLSIASWVNLTKPDMRVSEEGRIAFWDTSGSVLVVDRKRGDGFGRLQFLEQSGYPLAAIEGFADKRIPCDDLGCRIRIEDKLISVLYEPEGVIQACADSDLVILTQRRAGPVAKWKCKVKLIDTRNLSENGALDIAVHNGQIKFKVANPERRKNRPWGY